MKDYHEKLKQDPNTIQRQQVLVLLMITVRIMKIEGITYIVGSFTFGVCSLDSGTCVDACYEKNSGVL